MLSFETVIGLSAGLFTGVSMLPQLIKMIKLKKAEDVSVVMLLILLSGLALWVYYGILKQDIPIIITNSFSLAVSSLVFFFKLKYRNR